MGDPVRKMVVVIDPKQGGGDRIMLDYDSHLFALVLHFMDDVEKVFS